MARAKCNSRRIIHVCHVRESKRLLSLEEWTNILVKGNQIFISLYIQIFDGNVKRLVSGSLIYGFSISRFDIIRLVIRLVMEPWSHTSFSGNRPDHAPTPFP